MSDKNSTEYALLAAAQAGTMTASAEPASPYTFGRMIEVDDPTGPSSTTRLDVKRPARPRLTRERVRVLSTAGGRGTLENHRWLRENQASYRGRWVALRRGTLVDSDERRIVLHERLKTAGTLDRELHFVKIW